MNDGPGVARKLAFFTQRGGPTSAPTDKVVMTRLSARRNEALRSQRSGTP